MTITHHYRTLSLAVALALTALSPNASATTLPPLDSINQLGELQFHPPTSTQFTTSHGVPVRFTALDALPIVDISVSFAAGSGYDGDKLGVANMTATMLTAGTKQLDEEALLQTVDMLGMTINADASKDVFEVHLRSLSHPETLTAAVALLSDILAHPRFDPKVLERNKSELLTYLRQQETNPNYLARRTFGQALYGNHPYAHPITGDSESIPALTSQDLQQFHKQLLTQQNAVITITGQLDNTQARAITEQIAHSLPLGKKPERLPAPKPMPAQHVHVPYNSNQSVVIMGNLTSGFAKDPASLQQSSDFSLANDVLADGDFSARLMQEIRVKQGYTYGISGGRSKFSDGGHYAISFSTQADVAEQAIKDSLQVINETLKTGIDQQELTLAVFDNKNSYPNAFASNAGLHNVMTTMSFYELPDDYLQNYIQRLDNATLPTVNNALQDTIHPEQFTIVTVGQDKPSLP